MDRSTKVAFVNDYADKFANAKMIVVNNFAGVTVEEINRLRQSVRQTDGAEYRVVKNTLAKRLISDTPKGDLADHFSGVSSVLLSEGDIVASAKVLVDFAKDVEAFEIKAAWIDGATTDVAAITALSKLPPKEVLQAKLLGVLQAPAQNLMTVLSGVPRNLLNVLSAYRDQLDGEG